MLPCSPHWGATFSSFLLIFGTSRVVYSDLIRPNSASWTSQRLKNATSSFYGRQATFSPCPDTQTPPRAYIPSTYGVSINGTDAASMWASTLALPTLHFTVAIQHAHGQLCTEYCIGLVYFTDCPAARIIPSG